MRIVKGNACEVLSSGMAALEAPQQMVSFEEWDI